jgi:nickel-dependent lactate racemase
VVEIWLPYGSSEIPARIPEERLVDILKPAKKDSISDPAAAMRRAIESNQPILDTARRAERICVGLGSSSNAQVASAATQTLVESLVAVGASPSSITLLRTAGAPELDPALLGNTKTTLHDPVTSPTTSVAYAECDFPISLNSTFAAASLKIVIGELKPHHFLGYGGLCDIVFPGLASLDSVRNHLANRKNMAVSDLHRERVEIARSFEDLFALGFVLDSEQSLVKISLRSFKSCLEDLEKVVQTVCTRRFDQTADIVVMSAGGRPMDESLLSAVETLPAAIPALKRDGVLIVAAECPLGHGNTEFHQWCAEHKEARYLEARLRHNFNYQGFKAAFLLRTLENHRIYFVSTIPNHYVENVFGMRAAATVNSALQTAQRSLGSTSKISVIPNASRIILTRAEHDAK